MDRKSWNPKGHKGLIINHLLYRPWSEWEKTCLGCCSQTGVRKISSVAYGFSPIKIQFSDYTKSLISGMNEVHVFLYSFITVCFAAITLVIVLATFCDLTSHYLTSVTRYQSRSSMYIRGLIPRNWPRQFRLHQWVEEIGSRFSPAFCLQRSQGTNRLQKIISSI